MYGIIISLSILISALFAERIAKSKNLNPEVLWGGLVWAVVFGVVGARIYHVVDYWELYLQDPQRIFMLWRGGLGIIGGVALGGAALTVYLKLQKQPILEWLDIAALVLPLGQALGRWGNIFNREMLPMAYYEMILDYILLGILYLVYTKTSRKGLTLAVYFAGYSLIRIFRLSLS